MFASCSEPRIPENKPVFGHSGQIEIWGGFIGFPLWGAPFWGEAIGRGAESPWGCRVGAPKARAEGRKRPGGAGGGEATKRRGVIV